jgi:hypothetical protein
MSWSRDCAHAASRCLRVALLLGSLLSHLGCTHGVARVAGGPRAALAQLVPKLDLRWELLEPRNVRGAGSDIGDSARVQTGIAAWLRWQPTVYAAQSPGPYELSPAAWAAPCELPDDTCFAELAEAEREIGDALKQER